MASTRQVRDWALGKGWDVPPRGRLPAVIVEAFNAAHPDDTAAVPTKHPGGKTPAELAQFRRWGHPDETREQTIEHSRRGGRNAHPRLP